MLAKFRNLTAAPVLALCLILLAVWCSGIHWHRHLAHLHTVQNSEAVGADAHQHEHAAENALAVQHHQGPDDGGWHAPQALNSTTHQDVEMPVLGSFNAKPLGPEQLALVLAIVSFALLLRPRRVVCAKPHDPPFRPLKLVYLRPPLRGPPCSSPR